jgi:hypothetical protein
MRCREARRDAKILEQELHMQIMYSPHFTDVHEPHEAET